MFYYCRTSRQDCQILLCSLILFVSIRGGNGGPRFNHVFVLFLYNIVEFLCEKLGAPNFSHKNSTMLTLPRSKDQGVVKK